MGHAEPQVRTELQPYWMPFSPNKEFKNEPHMFARATGMYFYTPEGPRSSTPHRACSAWLPAIADPRSPRPSLSNSTRSTSPRPSCAPTPRPSSWHSAWPSTRRRGLNRIFFTNSGSEAVDTAMKTALVFHRVRGQAQRQLFVSRERAYHGVNMGGVALAGMVDNWRAYGPGLAGVYHMRHAALPQNKFARGQPEHGADLAEDLLRLCNLLGGENIAACFVEPTAGSFGCLPPPKGYLDRLRQTCDDNGILLVFDEVITGLGRMGANFGAQAFGVTPDLLTMAKAITNGAQPMGALAARQDIYDTITEAGPKQGIEFFMVTCAPGVLRRGLAMMDIFRDEKLIERAAAMSPIFADAMHSLADAPGVVDVRNFGMMAGIEVAAVGGPGANGHELQKVLYDRGLN